VLARRAGAGFAVALTGVSAYGCFAAFGVDWARSAGDSGFYAALWPIVMAATVFQAAICRAVVGRCASARRARLRLDAVLGGGMVIGVLGNTLHATSRGFAPVVAAVVSAVPAICLLIGIGNAVIFIRATGQDQQRGTR
jgi:hypothetical protein